MKCPTCSAEMEPVADLVHWCQKCGSKRNVVQHGVKQPELVGNVRNLVAWALEQDDRTWAALECFGIVDCISREIDQCTSRQ